MSSRFFKHIQVEGYRGLVRNTRIELAIPNGKLGGGLTLVVGSNGSGKSSILETIWWCLREEPPPGYRQNELVGQISLERVDGERILVESGPEPDRIMSRTQCAQMEKQKFCYISTEGIRLSIAAVEEPLFEEHDLSDSPGMNRLSPPGSPDRVKNIVDVLSDASLRGRYLELMHQFYPDFHDFKVVRSLLLGQLIVPRVWCQGTAF